MGCVVVVLISIGGFTQIGNATCLRKSACVNARFLTMTGENEGGNDKGHATTFGQKLENRMCSMDMGARCFSLLHQRT